MAQTCTCAYRRSGFILPAASAESGCIRIFVPYGKSYGAGSRNRTVPGRLGRPTVPMDNPRYLERLLRIELSEACVAHTLPTLGIAANWLVAGADLRHSGFPSVSRSLRALGASWRPFAHQPAHSPSGCALSYRGQPVGLSPAFRNMWRSSGALGAHAFGYRIPRSHLSTDLGARRYWRFREVFGEEFGAMGDSAPCGPIDSAVPINAANCGTP